MGQTYILETKERNDYQTLIDILDRTIGGFGVQKDIRGARSHPSDPNRAEYCTATYSGGLFRRGVNATLEFSWNSSRYYGTLNVSAPEKNLARLEEELKRHLPEIKKA